MECPVKKGNSTEIRAVHLNIRRQLHRLAEAVAVELAVFGQIQQILLAADLDDGPVVDASSARTGTGAEDSSRTAVMHRLMIP